MRKPVVEAARIQVPDGIDPILLYGEHDRHLRLLESSFNVMLSEADENGLQIQGERENIAVVAKALDLMVEELKAERPLAVSDVSYIVDMLQDSPSTPVDELKEGAIVLNRGRDKFQPRSANQAAYIRALRQAPVVFANGPAGTGKTYLAVAAALSALQRGEVRRIVLTRPVVEAGESLGFLPGDFETKINPYLRPLFDAIQDMIKGEEFRRLRETQVIELAPLAYMRGRTLNKAFVVLDEAQNTSIAQMKMFLTRLGEGSHVVATGDLTQIDLPGRVESGLRYAMNALADIEGVSMINFDRKDIVRHPLLTRIIHAFETYDG